MPTGASCSVFTGKSLMYSSNSNAFLEGKGVKMPKATSTGTTIVGCLFKDGIVLGADTRATAGDIVADKNCEKVLQVTEPL
jgi:20S proteasome alpha/beta subunit